MFGLPPVAAHVVEILFLLAFAAIATGAGGRLLNILGAAQALSVGERLLFGLALGYGLLGFAMLALGLAGLLTLPAGIAALTFFLLIGYGPLLGLWRELYPALRQWAGSLRGYGAWLFLGVVTVCVGASLIKALAPVATQDDLMYHLALPERYIQAQRIDFYPDSTYSLFPQLMEMLYSWGLLLGSDRLAVLFAWSAGLIGPAGAVLFAKRFLPVGDATKQQAFSLLVPAIFLSVPLVGYVLRAANTDLAQASFDFLAIYACWIGVANLTRRNATVVAESGKEGVRLIFMAGLLSGLSFSIKYYGFVIALLLGLALVAILITSRLKRYPSKSGTHTKEQSVEMGARPLPFQTLLAFVGGAALLALPWLVRNVFEAGNPIWPLGGRIFGGAYWSDVSQFAPETLLGKTPPLSVTSLWTGVEYLWYQMTRPPLLIDGQLHNVKLGFLLLPSLALLPFVRWTAALRWLAYAAGGYWLIWALFFSRTSVRYLSIFFLLAALLGAYAIVATAARWRPIGQAISGVVAVTLVVLAAQSAQSTAPYLNATFALNVGAERVFLSQHMEDYSMLEFIEGNTAEDARIYVWDGQPRGYYIPREYVYARLVPLYSGFGSRDVREWRERLAELAITHVLVHQRDILAPGQPPGEDPSLDESRIFAERYFSEPLFSVADYTLYALK